MIDAFSILPSECSEDDCLECSITRDLYEAFCAKVDEALDDRWFGVE